MLVGGRVTLQALLSRHGQCLKLGKQQLREMVRLSRRGQDALHTHGFCDFIQPGSCEDTTAEAFKAVLQLRKFACIQTEGRSPADLNLKCPGGHVFFDATPFLVGFKKGHQKEGYIFFWSNLKKTRPCTLASPQESTCQISTSLTQLASCCHTKTTTVAGRPTRILVAGSGTSS